MCRTFCSSTSISISIRMCKTRWIEVLDPSIKKKNGVLKVCLLIIKGLHIIIIINKQTLRTPFSFLIDGSNTNLHNLLL